MAIKRNRVLSTRLLIIFISFCLSVLAITGCGDGPAGPTDVNWVRLAVFPEEVDYVSGMARRGTTGVYAVTYARGSGSGAVYYFDNYDFSVVYDPANSGLSSNNQYDEASFFDIGFAVYGSEGWAVGFKQQYGDYEPLLVRFNITDGWYEEPITLEGGQILREVIPIAEDSCMLLRTEDFYEPRFDPLFHTGYLLRYANGVVRPYDDFGIVSAVYADRIEDIPDRVYVVAIDPIETGTGYSIKTHISQDKGDTWTEETSADDIFGGRRPDKVIARAYFGPELYISVEFDDGATGIVRRTGSPGVGEYEIVFLSYDGPFFTSFERMAFRSWSSELSGNGADGVGIGDNASVSFTPSGIYLEKLPYQLQFSALCKAGGIGFWASGTNGLTGKCEIFLHP